MPKTRKHLCLTILATVAGLAVCGLPSLVPFERACILHTPGDSGGLARPPSFDFFLGTDSIGRSEALRLLFAIRTSLLLAAPATALACGAALCLGLVASRTALTGERHFVARTADAAIDFLLDAALALPFVLVVACAAALSVEVTWSRLVGVLAFAATPSLAKVVRDRARSVAVAPFVEAARAIGGGVAHVAREHVGPACVRELAALAPSTFAQLLLMEAALGFLGLGLAPPHATLGNLVADGQDRLADAPWLLAFPTAALVALVFATDRLTRADETGPCGGDDA